MNLRLTDMSEGTYKNPNPLNMFSTYKEYLGEHFAGKDEFNDYKTKTDNDFKTFKANWDAASKTWLGKVDAEIKAREN